MFDNLVRLIKIINNIMTINTLQTDGNDDVIVIRANSQIYIYVCTILEWNSRIVIGIKHLNLNVSWNFERNHQRIDDFEKPMIN